MGRPNKAKKNKEKQKKIAEIAPEKATTEEAGEKYLYVYGIIKDPSFKSDLKGLKGQPIQKVYFQDLSALISFYPVLHPLVEEGEARQHVEILNKIAAETAVVPMSFGTVFKEQKILEAVLATSYPAIKETLELIKDKIELGVKAVKKGTAEISEETTQKIVKELNLLSMKSVSGDKFSDRLLLNHSFLVDKNRFSAFSDKIAQLEGEYADLKFLYTGPWPAYSFVNINIKVG